jgi:hypothetical protein
MVGDGTVGDGTLLQLPCTCLVEAAQLMADVGWWSALWRRRRAVGFGWQPGTPWWLSSPPPSYPHPPFSLLSGDSELRW